MRVVLKDGTLIVVSGADIREITISIHDDTILIALHSGDVLLAKSITAKER